MDAWLSHRVTLGESTLDHKLPRVRGGDDSEGNLVLACATNLSYAPVSIVSRETRQELFV